MRVNRFLMPIIVIVALLGTTLIAQAAGFWSTSGQRLYRPGKYERRRHQRVDDVAASDGWLEDFKGRIV